MGSTPCMGPGHAAPALPSDSLGAAAPRQPRCLWFLFLSFPFFSPFCHIKTTYCSGLFCSLRSRRVLPRDGFPPHFAKPSSSSPNGRRASVCRAPLRVVLGSTCKYLRKHRASQFTSSTFRLALPLRTLGDADGRGGQSVGNAGDSLSGMSAFITMFLW